MGQRSIILSRTGPNSGSYNGYGLTGAALVYELNNTTTRDGTLVVEYDQAFIGAQIAVTASNTNENYFVLVDGARIDLNTYIANGWATSNSNSGGSVVAPNGSLVGGGNGN